MSAPEDVVGKEAPSLNERNQAARHAEIERRYGRRQAGKKRSSYELWMMRRRSELIKAGRWNCDHDPLWSPVVEDWAYAFADVVHHLGGNDDDVRRHAKDAGLDIDKNTASAALAATSNAARPLDGIYLGKLIGLTCEQRLDCGITTIYAVDETLKERRDRVAAARQERDKRRKRLERASKPKHIPLSVSRPWEACRMSKRTWYRRGKPDPVAQNPSTPQF